MDKMIRHYTSRSRQWFVWLPWWAWLLGALLWLLGWAVVCALTLVWIIVRLPLMGIDRLTGHRPSNFAKLAAWQFRQPVSFDDARERALRRHDDER